MATLTIGSIVRGKENKNKLYVKFNDFQGDVVFRDSLGNEQKIERLFIGKKFDKDPDFVKHSVYIFREDVEDLSLDEEEENDE